MNEEEIRAKFIKLMYQYTLQGGLDHKYHFSQIKPPILEEVNDFVIMGFLISYYDDNGCHRFTLTDLGKEIIEPHAIFRTL